jgi:hypothetical protein
MLSGFQPVGLAAHRFSSIGPDSTWAQRRVTPPGAARALHAMKTTFWRCTPLRGRSTSAAFASASSLMRACASPKYSCSGLKTAPPGSSGPSLGRGTYSPGAASGLVSRPPLHAMAALAAAATSKGARL